MRLSIRPVTPVLSLLVAVAGCDRPASETSATDTTAATTQTPAPPAPESVPRAPDVFRVRFETSGGSFVVESRRAWSPNGVDRFHQLVTSGFYDNNRFFRVVPGFVVQFGIHGDPAVARQWERLSIPDDPVAQNNRRGTLSFATAGPNTRTTQLFINYADNLNLDAMGFSPIGRVIEGMDVVDRIHSGYGERPDQGRITTEGNAYLEREFPELDFIRTARVVPQAVADSTARPDSAAR